MGMPRARPEPPRNPGIVPRSEWVQDYRKAMEAGAAAAAAAAGVDNDEEEEEEAFVGPQPPEGVAPGDRGNWGGALRPGANP